VTHRHIHQQRDERSAVGSYLAEDAAPIVRHREVAILRGVRDRISALNAAHDGDVPVPSTIYVEVPSRIEEQVNAATSIVERWVNEVQCPYRSRTPIGSAGFESSASEVPGVSLDSNGGSICCLSYVAMGRSGV